MNAYLMIIAVESDDPDHSIREIHIKNIYSVVKEYRFLAIMSLCLRNRKENLSIRIMDKASIHTELPLSLVKDCYNLQLHISPLTLSRQSGNELDIVWPEKAILSIEDHDSFFLRDGEKLFFNRWFEEGEGVDYKYWEETIVRDLNGNVIEILPGDVMMMPNGEMWHLK